MPNNEYYLISKDLAESIWTELKDKYESWPPAPWSYPSNPPTSEDIPSIIQSIQSAEPGSSVNPMTLAGSTGITTVWVGNASSCPTSRDANTIYIITDGNS